MKFFNFLNESEDIVLFRAMNKEEFDATLKNKKPTFISRFKWFSPNIDFILKRVKGSDFNNSRIEKERYNFILKFVIDKKDLKHFKLLNKNEYMLDRRNIQLINWKNIEEKKDEFR